MFKPLYLFIGTRYLISNNSRFFFSKSFISISSVILSVMILIIVISVLNGFDYEMRNRILGLVPQVTINSYKPINNWKVLEKYIKTNTKFFKKVLAIAPLTQIYAILSKNGIIHNIMINAISPQEEKKVSVINNYLKFGSIKILKPNKFGIIISEQLAKKFNIKIGNKITLVLPEFLVTIAGIFPTVKQFTVVNIFNVGVNDIDNNISFIHIEDAAKLLRWNKNQVQSIKLKINDLFKAQKISSYLNNVFNTNLLFFNTWIDNYGNLYKAIHMDKTIISVLLFFILIIAAFNIISNFILMIINKKSDIIILQRLGVSKKELIKIFLINGLIIGIIGITIGLILGIFVSYYFTNIITFIEKSLSVKFIQEDVYFINYLPSKLILQDIIIICSTTILLIFLATLYAALLIVKNETSKQIV